MIRRGCLRLVGQPRFGCCDLLSHTECLSANDIASLSGLPAKTGRGMLMYIIPIAHMATVTLLMFDNSARSGGLHRCESVSPQLFGKCIRCLYPANHLLAAAVCASYTFSPPANYLNHPRCFFVRHMLRLRPVAIAGERLACYYIDEFGIQRRQLVGNTSCENLRHPAPHGFYHSRSVAFKSKISRPVSIACTIRPGNRVCGNQMPYLMNITCVPPSLRYTPSREVRA